MQRKRKLRWKRLIGTIGIMAIILAGTATLLSRLGDKEDGGEEPAPSASQPAASQPAQGTASVAPSSSPTASAEVKKGSVKSIAFGEKEAAVSPGSSRTLAIQGYNDKSELVELTDKVKSDIEYTSDNADVISIDSEGTVKPGPKAVTGKSALITAEYKGVTATITVTVKPALEETVAASAGKSVVTNMEDIAVVVNKTRALPDNYEPQDLTEPQVPFSFSGKSEKRMLRKEAAQALEKLFALAEKDGIKLYGVSGYRSRSTQVSVYNNNVKTQGEEEANKVSAKPGFSEHQTGLAIDVSSASADYSLEEVFGSTKEGKWLAAHAHEAGFIIRYPKGKESITGYSYEPWHIRYVGLDIAKDIFENNWTLEEYFQDAIPVNG